MHIIRVCFVVAHISGRFSLPVLYSFCPLPFAAIKCIASASLSLPFFANYGVTSCALESEKTARRAVLSCCSMTFSGFLNDRAAVLSGKRWRSHFSLWHRLVTAVEVGYASYSNYTLTFDQLITLPTMRRALGLGIMHGPIAIVTVDEKARNRSGLWNIY